MKSGSILLLILIIQFTSLVNAFDVFALSDYPVEPNIEKAQFDEEKLKELASDKSFDYNRKYIPRNYSIREIIANWLYDKFRRLIILMGQNSKTTEYVFYVISVLGIGYFILKLLKIDTIGMFYRKNDRSYKPEIFSENIHQMDMEKALQDAVNAQEFKVAVRILYLSMLKLLDTKGLINWKQHKTNHDYESELIDEEIKLDFVSLTRYFEYIIYGNFSLNEAGFNHAKAIYEQAKKKIEQQPVIQ